METNDARWAERSNEDGAIALAEVVRRIRQEQEPLYQDRLIHASMYGGSELAAYSGGISSGTELAAPPNQLSLNIVKTMVNAATARIAARNPPKPTFVTDGANWDARSKAEAMDKGLAGIFKLEKVRKKTVRAFRSALIYGEGILCCEPDAVWGKPRITRALPGEFLVDQGEALTGEPRRLYRRRYYDRLVLTRMFPHAKKAIMESRESDDAFREWGWNKSKDQVLVTEGWSLPTGPGATDGRYMAILGSTCLESFRWTRERFPIARFVWEEPEEGWYGTGLAQELRGIQLDINDLLDRINDAIKVVAGKWAVERDSDVNPNDITDERDGILVYAGTAPMYITPQAVPPQMFEHLWNLWSRAHEITGISQLAASGMKPAGLNSGAAIRAYREDISERFSDKSADFEEFVCDVGRLTVDSMHDLAEVGDVRVRTVTKGALEVVDWKEVELDAEAYEMSIEASSTIPRTPAAHIELAEDLGKLGIFAPTALARILGAGVPDVEAVVKRMNATEDLTEQMLADILKTGEMNGNQPEPEMDLELAIPLAQELYVDYRRQRVPSDRLGLVLDWIRAAVAQRDQKRAAAPPPPQPPQGAPPPMPPPVP